MCCLASGSWHAIKVTKGNKGETRDGTRRKWAKIMRLLGGRWEGLTSRVVSDLVFQSPQGHLGLKCREKVIIHSALHPTNIECLLCAWLGALRWRSSDRGETVFLHKGPQRLGWVKPTRPINIIESGQCHERVIPGRRGPTLHHLAAWSQQRSHSGRRPRSGWFEGGDR